MGRGWLGLWIALSVGCDAVHPFVPSESPDSLPSSSNVLDGVQEYDFEEEPPPDSSTVVDPCKTVVCDDGEACTMDLCNGGVCIFTPEPESTACDDGEICTSDDHCLNGACVGGEETDCSDASDCTVDICEPGVGCQSESRADGSACDDGDACSVEDICEGGICIPFKVLSCEDFNPCTVLQGCDPSTGKCIFLQVPDGGLCDDGNVCSAGDACINGSCVSGAAPPCDDGITCTLDVCDPKLGCTHLWQEGSCDDGDPCTTEDSCTDDGCFGVPLNCDDGESCTEDSCGEDGGCVHSPISGSCTDGNACTLGDACEEGSCVPGPLAECAPSGPCETALCDPATGLCTATLWDAGTSCEDGDACTQEEQCDGDGGCVGEPIECAEDGELCELVQCDSESGCETLPANGEFCTPPEGCGTGLCTDGECVIQPGTECDDGNLCTTDICNEVLGCLYLTNPAEICDDGVGCTLDSCVPEEGCQHDPIAAICDDGSPCTAFLCDPVDGCSFELQVGCCGNGLVEGGEFCDDGNGAPGDGCSPLCKGEIGSGYPSCAHILFAFPLAQSGIYTIDVDGPEGGTSPQKVHCNMEADGGGWTLNETYASNQVYALLLFFVKLPEYQLK